MSKSEKRDSSPEVLIGTAAKGPLVPIEQFNQGSGDHRDAEPEVILGPAPTQSNRGSFAEAARLMPKVIVSAFARVSPPPRPLEITKEPDSDSPRHSAVVTREKLGQVLAERNPRRNSFVSVRGPILYEQAFEQSAESPEAQKLKAARAKVESFALEFGEAVKDSMMREKRQKERKKHWPTTKAAIFFGWTVPNEIFHGIKGIIYNNADREHARILEIPAKKRQEARDECQISIRTAWIEAISELIEAHPELADNISASKEDPRVQELLRIKVAEAKELLCQKLDKIDEEEEGEDQKALLEDCISRSAYLRAKLRISKKAENLKEGFLDWQDESLRAAKKRWREFSFDPKDLGEDLKILAYKLRAKFVLPKIKRGILISALAALGAGGVGLAIWASAKSDAGQSETADQTDQKKELPVAGVEDPKQKQEVAVQQNNSQTTVQQQSPAPASIPAPASVATPNVAPAPAKIKIAKNDSARQKSQPKIVTQKTQPKVLASDTGSCKVLPGAQICIPQHIYIQPMDPDYFNGRGKYDTKINNVPLAQQNAKAAPDKSEIESPKQPVAKLSGQQFSKLSAPKSPGRLKYDPQLWQRVKERFDQIEARARQVFAKETLPGGPRSAAEVLFSGRNLFPKPISLKCRPSDGCNEKADLERRLADARRKIFNCRETIEQCSAKVDEDLSAADKILAKNAEIKKTFVKINLALQMDRMNYGVDQKLQLIDEIRTLRGIENFEGFNLSAYREMAKTEQNWWLANKTVYAQVSESDLRAHLLAFQRANQALDWAMYQFRYSKLARI